MINHIRTLLLNRDGNHGYGYDYPGEEFVLPTFRAKAVPTFLNGALRMLFGSNPDRLFLNYRMRQIMSLLHSTELEEFVLFPDDRVTYWPMVDDGFANVFQASSEVIDLGSWSWMYPSAYDWYYTSGDVGGTLESLYHDDGDRVYGNEKQGMAPLALEIRFNFDGPVPLDRNLEVRFNGYYTGTDDRLIIIQGDEAPGQIAFNWTGLTGFDKDFADGGTEDVDLVFPLAQKYVDTTLGNRVSLRIVAAGPLGNGLSYLYIDQLTLGVSGASGPRLFLAGDHGADEGAGILEQQWRIEVIDDNNVKVTRQTPPLTSSIEECTLTDSLTSEIPLSGTGLKFRISVPTAGDSWLITSRAKPQNDFGAVLQSAAQLIGQSGIDNLFRSTVEPIPTLKSVWESHSLFPYKYSALLLAIAYYLEMTAATGGTVN